MINILAQVDVDLGFLFFFSGRVDIIFEKLLKPHVPGYRGYGGGGSELVHDVARDYVHVIIAKLYTRERNPIITTQ